MFNFLSNNQLCLSGGTHLIPLAALRQIVMIAKMIPFSWQRSMLDETDFLFTPAKGGV